MDAAALAFGLLDFLVLLVYLKDAGKKRLSALWPVVASVVTVAIAILLLHYYAAQALAFYMLGFALLFAIMPFYYMSRPGATLLILALAVLEFLYASYAYGPILYQFVQALAIGTAYGFMYRGGFGILHNRHGASKKIEASRDYVHLVLGVIVFAIFLLLPLYYAIYAITALIVLGYATTSVLGKHRKGRLFAVLNSFERPDSIYGLGALYLGTGTLLLVGFVHSIGFLAVGLAGLLFADPIATIVGSKIEGMKLFYNKRKSVAGTTAFFLAVAVIGYPFVGIYSVGFGLLLALIESAELPIDDNISIAVAMIVVYAFFLAGLGALPF